jgi:hypothetical protein
VSFIAKGGLERARHKRERNGGGGGSGWQHLPGHSTRVSNACGAEQDWGWATACDVTPYFSENKNPKKLFIYLNK